MANCSSSSCKRSSRYWSLFGLIARGQGLLALECGELLGRQQVVVEVAELPRALDPDVAGAQGVLQLGQGADFVEFPVEAFRGDHQRLPARLDEGRGCIGRHLAQVVGVHLTQGLHGCQHALRGRPVLFPNFSLGEEYEHAPPATNRQISPYLPSGRFRTGLPVEGLAIERGDLFYACPRASVFLWHGARRRPSDARRKHACHGRDKHHRRCSFKRRPGLVMRTTTCVWSRDCCYDPDRDAHEALLRSGFGGRVQVV